MDNFNNMFSFLSKTGHVPFFVWENKIVNQIEIMITGMIIPMYKVVQRRSPLVL